VSRVNESCYICKSPDTHESVMSHIWMSHVTHMNGSCHTYEWVMSHIWMSHGTHMNESCHTWKRVVSHFEWVLSHRRSVQSFKSINPSYDSTLPQQGTYAMTHPWLHACDMTNSSVQCESILLKEPYILTKDHRILPKEPYVPLCPLKVRTPWLIYNFMCVRWPIHDSVRVTWVIDMCDMTPPFVWHDSTVRVTHPCTHKARVSWLIHDSIRVIWLIRQYSVNPFYSKSPIFCQKSPKFYQKSQVFVQKSLLNFAHEITQPKQHHIQICPLQNSTKRALQSERAP